MKSRTGKNRPPLLCNVCLKHLLGGCQRNWLSLLPFLLYGEKTLCCLSSAFWHSIQSRTPGSARRRASGMGAPHSSQCDRLSPFGSLLRALATSSSIESAIWSLTALSPAQPTAIGQPPYYTFDYDPIQEKKSLCVNRPCEDHALYQAAVKHPPNHANQATPFWRILSVCPYAPHKKTGTLSGPRASETVRPD